MLYENEVTSKKELARRLRVLDQDAGVRLIVRSGRSTLLVFVTRFGPKYTAMTYSTKSGAPGERVQTQEFDDVGGLERALSKFKGPLRAWVY